MNNKELSFTERIEQTLNDHELLVKKYGSIEDVLRFLRNPDNFKTLPELIQETMVKSGVCKKDCTIKECITVLIKLSRERQAGLAESNIRKWLNGISKSITRREDAIKICFALNLDEKATEQFLNKSGHQSLNFRSAEDVTYLYCILNREHILNNSKNLYPTANNILNRYYQSDSFAQAIKDAMVNAGFCEENCVPDELVSRLFVLGKNYGLKEKDIYNWIFGIEDISDIKDALRICLSLGMNVEDINEFLLRIGIHVFSIHMEADDKNYYFTINSRPYRIPCKNAAKTDVRNDSAKQNDYIENQHSGNTTQILSKEFDGVQWNDEDSFINTYLIPNKKKFFNFSYNAMKEYYTIKNHCLLLVLLFGVESSESTSESNRFTKELDDAITAFLRKDNALRDTLIRCNRRGLSSKQTILKLLKEQYENDTFDYQLQLSEFLNYAISMERVLTYNLDSLRKEGKAQDPLFTVIDKNDNDEDRNTSERLPDRAILDIIEDFEELNFFFKNSSFFDGDFSVYCDADGWKPRKGLIKSSLLKEEGDDGYASFKENSFGFNDESLKPVRRKDEKVFKDGVVNCLNRQYKKRHTLRQKMEYAILLLYYLSDLCPIDIENLNNEDFIRCSCGVNPSFSPVVTKAIKEYQAAKGYGRIRAYKDSELNETVLKDFTNKATISSFEMDPSIMFQNRSVRKTIMLMVYMIYVYENHIARVSDNKKGEENKQEEAFLPNSIAIFDIDLKRIQTDLDYSFLFMFSGINIKEFRETMDNVLEKCHLYPIYLPNAYDYLIVRSALDFGKDGISMNDNAKKVLEEYFDNNKADSDDYEGSYNSREFSRQLEFYNTSPFGFLNIILGESFDALSIYQNKISRLQITEDSVLRFHFTPESSQRYDFSIKMVFGNGLMNLNYIDSGCGYQTFEKKKNIEFVQDCKKGQLYTFELQVYDIDEFAEIEILVESHTC